jgi:cholesterol transport system auxiliary component
MTPPMSRRMLVGVTAVTLAGCASLFVNPPPHYIFRLTPVGVFPPDLPHVRAQLLVDAPTAPAALDQRRIALSRSPISLDYFADAEWADALSALVQTVLADSFENSRAIIAVNGSLGLPADFVLQTEIRHFEAEYAGANGPPDARVAIGAKLVAMPARAVIRQALFERLVPASANDLPAIVTAFNAALGVVATEIIQWTLAAVAMSRPPSRL